MLRSIGFVLYFTVLVTITLALRADYVNKAHRNPNKVRFYPKKTVFLKADLIDVGCVVFINQCPQTYKTTQICARHYDGKYKTFENYCLMEYENCNSWRREYLGVDNGHIREWSMIKRDRCT